MGSTGKLVVSYEAVLYSDDPLETRVKNILTPYADAFDEMSEGRKENRGRCLSKTGNTFILRILYMDEGTFNSLLESLISVSTDGWLLVYGGLDDGASILLEVKNREIITQRERRQADELNNYSDEEEAYYSIDDVRDDVPF